MLFLFQWKCLCTVIPAMVQRLRFSINVQNLSHKFGFNEDQRCQQLKHRCERLPKTQKIAFTREVLHIYGRVAELCRKKGVAPLRELLYIYVSKLNNCTIFMPSSHIQGKLFRHPKSKTSSLIVTTRLSGSLE